MGKKMVLFVCAGNTCRSPFAAGLFNKYAGEYRLKIEAQSAGLTVFFPSGANENSIYVAQKYGFDLTGHISREITEELIAQATRVFCVERAHCVKLREHFPDHAKKIGQLGERDIHDPYGMGLPAYEQMAGEIDWALLALLEDVDKWSK